MAAEWTIHPIIMEENERQYGTRTLGDGIIVDAFFWSMMSQQSTGAPMAVKGGLAPDTNGTISRVAQDTCVCNNKPGQDEPGYAGSTCQQILSDPQCRNG